MTPSPDPRGFFGAVPDLPAGDLWVFAYGSLMWRPGFAVIESRRARLHGLHRALCVRSWVHRGTRARPGLVLGLDAGGSCSGRALRVGRAAKADVALYLYRREMATPVYRARLRRIHPQGRRPVTALTFVVDRRHPQYGGRLGVAEAAAIVRAGRGESGPNPEYVLSAADHLAELSIRDPFLAAVAARLRAEPDLS